MSILPNGISLHALAGLALFGVTVIEISHLGIAECSTCYPFTTTIGNSVLQRH